MSQDKKNVPVDKSAIQYNANGVRRLIETNKLLKFEFDVYRFNSASVASPGGTRLHEIIHRTRFM